MISLNSQLPRHKVRGQLVTMAFVELIRNAAALRSRSTLRTLFAVGLVTLT